MPKKEKMVMPKRVVKRSGFTKKQRKTIEERREIDKAWVKIQTEKAHYVEQIAALKQQVAVLNRDMAGQVQERVDAIRGGYKKRIQALGKEIQKLDKEKRLLGQRCDELIDLLQSLREELAGAWKRWGEQRTQDRKFEQAWANNCREQLKNAQWVLDLLQGRDEKELEHHVFGEELRFDEDGELTDYCSAKQMKEAVRAGIRVEVEEASLEKLIQGQDPIEEGLTPNQGPH